jgi:hypothetical protein
MRYREIEEGFDYSSNIEFKQNTLIRTIYDESVVNDYNSYDSTFFFENPDKATKHFTDKIPFQSKYWV